jgi:NitT/TauT family transport system substrate-binding protein
VREITTAKIETSVALTKGKGIVDSGEAIAAGIDAMSPRRIQDFYNQMVKAGLYKPGEVDLLKVATLQFVNKRVGQDLKAQLTKCR